MMHLESVDRILDYLEENIDERHCAAVEKAHMEALGFHRDVAVPLSVYCRPEGEMMSNVEAFYNPEVMLYNELQKSETFGNVMNSVRIQDDYPLHIRSNHGLALTHSLYGGHFVLNEGETPWAEAKGCLSEFYGKWREEPFDVEVNEMVRRVKDTYQYYNERLSDYPKCRKWIKLTHPDMQGPLNSAQSLFGTEFFYELYENPEEVHWLLDKIARTYVELYRYLDPYVNNHVEYEGERAVYIHGAIYPGEVLLKNDTATAMLSKEHYEEFCRPYDAWILEQLGGGSIHYCGASQPFHADAIRTPGLKGLNFGDPQMQDVDGFLEKWSSRKVAAVCWGYHQPPQFLYDTLRDREVTGFTLCCTIDDIGRAADAVKRYREEGLKSLGRKDI